MHYSYIAIEGNIGAGKTTLAQLIAAKLHAQLLLEQFADNPFLTDFYKDPQRFAFTVEMAFMAERYHQLDENLVQADLFNTPYIADYHPLKSKIFASINLPEKEYRLYAKFFDLMFQSFRKPDVLVFLKSSIDLLQYNIKQRNRNFEQDIPDAYLQKLDSAYAQFLKQVNVPVIVVDKEKFDFVENPNHVASLIEVIGGIKAPELYNF